MKTLVSMLLFSSLTIAPAVGGDAAPRGDLARLQGRWITRAGPRRDIAVTLDVEGRKAKVKVATPQGMKFEVCGEVKVDETASPRALDWVKFSAPDGQDLPEIPAIYELKGGTLRVCNGGPNNPRPSEFEPGDGILAELLTFQRPDRQPEPSR